MAAATLADLLSDVDDLLAGDLEEERAKRLINEGNIELCTRSGWTKDTLEFGPTVKGQTFYDIPDEYRAPAEEVVVVGQNTEYAPADPGTVRKVRAGILVEMAPGLWWIDYQGGARKLAIAPVSKSGLSVRQLCVVAPPDLEDDSDASPAPADIARPAILHYVAMVALGTQEDDLEGDSYHRQEFERQVLRLTRLRNQIESGDGPIQVQIQGVHWR